jgi:hypothetical protein
MPIAYVQEFDVDANDRSTTGYDAIAERLNAEADPPAGLILHTAGFADDVFRIFDVWESEDQLRRFQDERLTPIIEQAMRDGIVGGPPPREYTYDLHDLVRG